MSKIEPITITAADCEELERLVRDRNTAQKVVWRARIVLLAADGVAAGAVAAATGKSQLTVRRWRRRFLAKGVEGLLKDASRPPRRKPLTAEKIAEVVHMTLHARPPTATRYATLMDGFLSLDKVVETGIGISRHTAWRWRHRMLAAQVALQSDKVSGVVETDETFFRTSYKGHRGWKRGAPPETRPARRRGGKALSAGMSGELVPVLTAVDRAGGIVEAVLRDRSCIVPALDGRIAEGSVVCSDGLKAYVAVAVKHGSEHRRIFPPRKDWLAKAVGEKPRRKGRLGLGRVNGHHERLKTFVNRELRGVSTKYLANYLGWMRAMRRPGFGPPVLIQRGLAAWIRWTNFFLSTTQWLRTII